MYIASVSFGLLAFILIYAGYRQMKRKIGQGLYLNHITETRNEFKNLEFDENRFILYPRSTLFSSKKHPAAYYLKGMLYGQFNQPSQLHTPGGKINIIRGKILIYASRHPVFFIQTGMLIYENDTFKGPTLYVDSAHKIIHHFSDSLPKPPYYIAIKMDSITVVRHLQKLSQTKKISQFNKDGSNKYTGIIALP